MAKTSAKGQSATPIQPEISDLHEAPVPSNKQLSELAKVAEECLSGLAEIAFVLHGQRRGFDQDQVEKLNDAMTRIKELVGSSESPVNASVLVWLGQFQTKAIFVGPRLWSRSRHHAVIRTCKNYLNWWFWTRERHAQKSDGLAVVDFADCIREQKLFLSKSKVWAWGAKLKVEAAKARLMIRQLQPRLSFKERLIVNALRTNRKPMNGEDLLAAAKLACTGSHKEILAGLDDRGVIIANRGAGYHLPEWLLTESRTKSV